MSEWALEDETEVGFFSSMWEETSALEVERLWNWEVATDRGTADRMRVFLSTPEETIQSSWALPLLGMARRSDLVFCFYDWGEHLSQVSISSSDITIDLLDNLSAPRTWDEVKSRYTLRDPGSVRRFLVLHPELGDILVEGFAQVTELFGQDQPVALEVVDDPEIEDDEKLVAFIYTSLEPDEALARLDELDRRWFLDQLYRVKQRFNFNLVFV